MRPGSLLALHGFLGHPVAFAGLELGSQVEHVSIPRMLGHGPRPEVSSATFDTEVERLLDHAETLPAPRRLLGYSQGARLALGLLAGRPQLFDAALLIGAQPGCQTPQERLLRRALEDAWIAQLEDEGLDAFVERFGRLPLFGPARPHDRTERPHRWEHTADGIVSALLVLGTSQMPNLWPRLAAIRCPIELWVGANDEKFRDIARSMLQSLPTGRVREFEDAYHNPLTDTPRAAKERFCAWLAA